MTWEVATVVEQKLRWLEKEEEEKEGKGKERKRGESLETIKRNSRKELTLNEVVMEVERILQMEIVKEGSGGEGREGSGQRY